MDEKASDHADHLFVALRDLLEAYSDRGVELQLSAHVDRVRAACRAMDAWVEFCRVRDSLGRDRDA